MKKISILDQFAADAINAPAVITGGSGKCGSKGSSKHKSKKSKSSKSKCTKSKSSKSKKSGSKSGCGCDPKLCW